MSSQVADQWRCTSCLSPNSGQHRMCTSCKKWRDLDWSCVMCGYKNFAKRDTCKECGAGHVPEFQQDQGNYDNQLQNQEDASAMCWPDTGYNYQVTFQNYAPEPAVTYPSSTDTAAVFPEKEIPWLCGMCNIENTPKRILCFECSGHRERVEVRNRAAESRLGHVVAPPPNVPRQSFNVPPPPRHSEFPVESRDLTRVQYRPGGVVEDQTLDWDCGACKNRNFAKRTKCNMCQKPRSEVEVKRQQTPPWIRMEPKEAPPVRGPGPIPSLHNGGRPEDRTKDWACSSCNNRNFAKREKCNRCGKPREEVEDKSVEYPAEVPPAPSLKRPPEPLMRSGHWSGPGRRSLPPPMPRQEDLSNDWVCSKCNINCFAKKTNCFRCGKPRAEVENRDADVRQFERQVSEPLAAFPPRPQQQSIPGHNLRLNNSSWNDFSPRQSGWQRPPEKKRKWVDEDKSNDWNCKVCKINNFAKRKSCFSCSKNRDEVEEKGDEKGVLNSDSNPTSDTTQATEEQD